MSARTRELLPLLAACLLLALGIWVNTGTLAPYAITEESGPGSADSARFLAAGARRSFWLRTAVGQLGNAAAVIREIVDSSENTIVESNSIMQFWKPDLYIMVLDFQTPDFKDSALRYLDRADCLVTVGQGEPQWRGVSRRLWDSKPRYAGAELAQFVDQRMQAASARIENARVPTSG